MNNLFMSCVTHLLDYILNSPQGSYANSVTVCSFQNFDDSNVLEYR